MPQRLEEELKERLHTKKFVKKDVSVSGSCISNGFCYIIDNDEAIFVKTNAAQHADVMFQGEYESLKQIMATKTIKVPKPVLVMLNYDESQASAFAMEYLDIKPLSDRCAKNLGRSLANLHDYNNKVIRYNKKARKWIGNELPSVKRATSSSETTGGKYTKDCIEPEDGEEENQFAKHSMIKNNVCEKSGSPGHEEYPQRFVPESGTEEINQFGFNVPTSCGLIPQVNEWTDEWIPFFARHRLDKSIRSLLSDHGDRELSQQWSQLQLKVDKFFVDFEPREEKIVPALLHGDLWSGNVAMLHDESQGVIYDPSSFYGHSEYDFGIARMFGGVSRTLEDSYFEIFPKKKLFEKRNKLYQLFHHLNHWDHFGSGYRSSSLRLIKDLNALV